MALVVSHALKYEGLERHSAMCKPLFSSHRLRQGAWADGVDRGPWCFKKSAITNCSII